MSQRARDEEDTLGEHGPLNQWREAHVNSETKQHTQNLHGSVPSLLHVFVAFTLI